MTGTQTCSKCGGVFERIGQHWVAKPDHYPAFTDTQRNIIIGLLLGDGSLNRQGKNAHMQVQMTNRKYLEHLDEIFDVLGTGVKRCRTAEESAKNVRNNGLNPDAKAENYSDVYEWRTRNHPELNQYRSWYSTEELVWPEEVELTPTVLRTWYISDGSYNKNHITISTRNESNNIEKIKRYFKRANLPTPISNSQEIEGEQNKCQLRWTVEESTMLFEYMEDAPPDFDYKWPEANETDDQLTIGRFDLSNTAHAT